MSDPDEIEVIGYGNEELTEYIVYIKRPGKRLSTEEICIELETLAYDLNKADLQMRRSVIQ